MSLRRKLLLAQLPLAAALMIVGGSAVWSVSALSMQSELILRDNYRSVLAMERVKESIERVDSAVLFVPLGRREKALAQIEMHRGQFELELKVQEGNITEPGEEEATRSLRDTWTVYQERLVEYLRLEDPQALADFYFGTLEPAFLSVKQSAEKILTLNQDTMVHKSDKAQRSGERINAAVAFLSIGALMVGTVISLALTNHLLTPLSILTQGVNRLADGDFQARAFVSTHDEIGQLAVQFNTMAEHLQEYRSSSLGELMLAQQAAKAAIDSIPEPVIIFTPEGSVLDMNLAAESLLTQGHVPDKANRLASAMPELRAAVEKAREHVLHGNGAYLPHGLEDAFPVPALDGERWLIVRASPVYDGQRSIAGATVILQDVTRQRRFDELTNDLVATVAHEFRTPLTSLRMAIHLCLEGTAGTLNEKQADLLQVGREDCQRLQTMVDELLDFARIQSGNIEIRRRPVTAQSLVKQALETKRLAAREKGLNLEQEGFHPLEKVTADAERIQLVFSNLITNAIRHTPAGGTIRLSALASGDSVRFEVIDTSEGIAQEHQPHVFERFFRVPGVASGAAGLGLALCKEIINGHCGEIGIVSQPGKGSTFWFTLPIASETETGQAVSA